MKMKRFLVLVLCVLTATVLMQCAKESTPKNSLTQTGEDKATSEENKEDDIIASRTVLARPLTEEEMKYMKIFYYIPKEESQAPIPAVVTLNTKDQSFTLEHDPASSYWIKGKYIQEEKDGKKVLKGQTDDGKYTYRFEMPDENSLVFIEEGSNPLEPHDDRVGVKMKDKMVFLKGSFASKTVIARPLTEEEMKYMKVFYHIPEGENQEPVLIAIRLNTKDQSFTLGHDASSSHIQGKYTEEEKDGKKVLSCRTDGGKYTYRFEMPDENSLVFMEEGSNPLNFFEDQRSVKIKDKMIFLSPEALEKKK